MTKTGDTRALLTIQEAAEVLSVSVSTLRRWDRDGILPAFRPGGRIIRYRSGDLRTFAHGETASA